MPTPMLRRVALPLLAFLTLGAPTLAQSYTASLTRPNFIGSSTASGTVSATLTGTTLVVTGSFSGLSGKYAESHLHTGTPDAPGPVAAVLNAVLAAGDRAGTFQASANTVTLTSEQATALRTGGLYADVHSLFYPDGEVRGRFDPTIATVRTSAVLSTVTTEGIVTRAVGRNVWIQDGAAALILFGPAGSPLATAVASGAVRVGDRITATGRLVEFGATAGAPGTGLIQIDMIAAGNFVVLRRDEGLPPVPTLSLAQVVDGEPDTDDYESEIVRVTDLTLDAAGDARFVAAKNYTVSQTVGGVTTTMIFRIASAGDTQLTGTAIPTGPFTFQGPVGQFRGVNQLQPIYTTDVVPGGTASAETPAGRLTLDVANPLRGAVLVRFSAETAQDVRVALYDVLGRQVATLADGAASGAQSATLQTAGLAPGVYVLRLVAGTGVLTQTVTVIR